MLLCSGLPKPDWLQLLQKLGDSVFQAKVVRYCFALTEITGFIGAGFDFSPKSPQIRALSEELFEARQLLGYSHDSQIVPIGVGFITTKGESSDFIANVLPVILKHRVAAVWLFAPSKRQCHASIIPALKQAGLEWGLKVFVQVGSVQSAREAVEDGADILVVQGIDAGGHQWAQGASLVSLLPETVDMLAAEFQGSHVQILGAGGIVDGRGVAAALVLGANGVVMGSRFVVTVECPASENTKYVMISTKDGGQSTVKSSIFDDIRETAIWPEVYDGRAIISDSYTDYLSGVKEAENIAKYKAAQKAGDVSREIVWAGSGVGLITSIVPASDVVKNSQEQARSILEELQKF